MSHKHLFQQDLFSNHRAKYVPVEKEMAMTIDNLVKTFYANKLGCVVCIEQSGALEINSNNFKVITTTGTYLFKRHLGQQDLNKIQNSLNIGQYLLNKSVAVPKMIRADDGELYCFNSDAYWTVSLFVDGNYFSGHSKQEVILTAQAIGKLFKALATLPEDIYPPEEIHYNLQEWDSLISECFQRKNEWISLFGLEIAQLLEKDWKVMESSLSTIKKKSVVTAELVPCHIDLHPHNILVGENFHATIIDLDSIKLANPKSMLAFGVYKLMRQYASNVIKECPVQEIKKTVWDFYKEVELDARVMGKEEDLLQYYAMMEVFRRICIIIKQNLRNSHSDWNHVLPIQIIALSEIKVLFECF